MGGLGDPEIGIRPDGGAVLADDHIDGSVTPTPEVPGSAGRCHLPVGFGPSLDSATQRPIGRTLPQPADEDIHRAGRAKPTESRFGGAQLMTHAPPVIGLRPRRAIRLPCEQPAGARWGRAQASKRPPQGVDRQRHGARRLEGHHTSGPERVHLLGRGRQAGGHPRPPYSPDPGGTGGRPTSALLLARVQTPRAHWQLAGAGESTGPWATTSAIVPPADKGHVALALRRCAREVMGR